jgi:type IX secretion system PorP/SprF family membrane protein
VWAYAQNNIFFFIIHFSRPITDYSMTKALTTLALGLLLFAATATAQEASTYSQYQLYPVLYNPGVTGFGGNQELIVNARKSLTGFVGTPLAYTAMYNGSFGDKLGLGASVFSENIGNFNTVKMQGNYAFRFKVQKTQIGIGLTTEFINQNLDNSVLENDLLDPTDPVVADWTNGRQYFDASAGTHILYDDKLFVGLALPNLVRSRIDQLALDVPLPLDTDDAPNFFFHFGYILNRENQGFKLIPSIAVRDYENVPFQVDLNVQGRFLQDQLIAAIMVRPGEAGQAGLMIGTQQKNLQLVYSYDIGFGPFQQQNNGSHELTLSYTLKAKSKKVGVAPPPQ